MNTLAIYPLVHLNMSPTLHPLALHAPIPVLIPMEGALSFKKIIGNVKHLFISNFH